VQVSSVGIHRPVFDPLAHHSEAWKGKWPFAEEDMMPMDFKSVWAAMEECRDLALPSSLESATFLARSFKTCSPPPLFLLQ
jgi:hypothetical protein